MEDDLRFYSLRQKKGIPFIWLVCVILLTWETKKHSSQGTCNLWALERDIVLSGMLRVRLRKKSVSDASTCRVIQQEFPFKI